MSLYKSTHLQPTSTIYTSPQNRKTSFMNHQTTSNRQAPLSSQYRLLPATNNIHRSNLRASTPDLQKTLYVDNPIHIEKPVIYDHLITETWPFYAQDDWNIRRRSNLDYPSHYNGNYVRDRHPSYLNYLKEKVNSHDYLKDSAWRDWYLNSKYFDYNYGIRNSQLGSGYRSKNYDKYSTGYLGHRSGLYEPYSSNNLRSDEIRWGAVCMFVMNHNMKYLRQ